MQYFVRLKVMIFFCYKNENIRCTKCPISTCPARKKTGVYVMSMLPWFAVFNLHSSLSLPFTPSLQSAFYTDGSCHSCLSGVMVVAVSRCMFFPMTFCYPCVTFLWEKMSIISPFTLLHQVACKVLSRGICLTLKSIFG